ncbi:MAG: glutathione-disulfide reductase [Paracoccus sp. (in: a-proteobacteria)]|uniref:glutathione-disulfide reductase n=1 Tax=Paracoccus sp. TaxID=267 RepID=UPI0026DF6CBF|nr:glutathione-disulfide reductase [Paracoccus sp. (in: a-proteobacteria)]MDO5622324.1 glutathione-disulfide reductase [Paracoccus sp. (in: a-proteobacteria)]
MSFDFDLFVIGGGSGGVRAGRIAAQHGARVALAEESRMGGTCVIRGCVPKKLMIFAGSAPEAVEEARGYGWSADAGRFDWPTFRAKLHSELDRLESAYTRNFEAAGGKLFHQRATVVDAHTVALADGSRHTAKHILIAVGGRPSLPGIEGQELGLISDDLFDLDAIPARTLIVGGGFIACEFATILNGLGSQVTLSYRGDLLLRGFDLGGRERVSAQIAEIGVDLRCNHNVVRLEKTADGIRAHDADGGSADYDAVFFATGRSPYTKGLGLENAGVTLGRAGEIVVDEWSQTNIPSIYAVGDVTNRVNLTPVAIREGHTFADTVFGATPRKMDHSLIASAVYTRPFELGTIGLTEEQAAKAGDTDVYEAVFRPMRTMFAGSEARVMMKLLVRVSDRKVVGCHIFGPEAGEMIQMVAIAIGMGATKEDFDATCAVHPTLAEELVTMRNPSRRVGPVA